MHRGLTETETHSFNDSRRLSFTKWASNVRRMPYEVGGEGRGGEGGYLPVGRGSERRILITATRTSSLGNTIWHRHTDACNPVGWSLRLNARFVQFGAAIPGFPDVTYCFVICLCLLCICYALTASVITYCRMGEPKWVQWEAFWRNFTKTHHRPRSALCLLWSEGFFGRLWWFWESSCAEAWLLLCWGARVRRCQTQPHNLIAPPPQLSARQLDRSGCDSKILLVHFRNLQQKAFSLLSVLKFY